MIENNLKNWISSTELSIILNENPWKDRNKLILEKAGVIQNTFKGNKSTFAGNKLEPKIINYFEILNDCQIIEKQTKYTKNVDNLCLLTYIDGLFNKNENNILFEAKTTSQKKWLDIPDYIKYQLEFNLQLTELEKSELCVAYLDKNKNIISYETFEYTRNNLDIKEICSNFYQEVLETYNRYANVL